MEVHMDTRLATRQFRIEQWSGIIKDRIDSGMTVDDYCSEHHLSKNAYYYWLRKVREHAINTAGIQFAELSSGTPGFSSGTPGFVPVVSVEVGTVTVNISEATPPHLLKSVFEVIKDVT